MSNETTSGGLGLPVILFLIFMTLKLTNHITWSWLWVTSPLWISFGLGLVLLGIVAAFSMASRN